MAVQGDPARASRGRPGDQQREQKRITREKLLQAARVIFENNPYARVSVDMIAEEASISRATFYRHFDSKFAVAMALFDDLGVQIRALWKELLELRDPSLSDTRAWLVRHIEVAGRDRVLGLTMRELGVNEPESEPRTLQFYESLMERMWGRKWDGRPGHFADLWARSLLLLLQMDEMFFAILSRNWAIGHKPMIEAMAALLHEFLQLRRRELQSMPRTLMKKGEDAVHDTI